MFEIKKTHPVYLKKKKNWAYKLSKDIKTQHSSLGISVLNGVCPKRKGHHVQISLSDNPFSDI